MGENETNTSAGEGKAGAEIQVCRESLPVMRRMAGLARRDIPIGAAVPWVALLALLPFCLPYWAFLLRALVVAVVGAFTSYRPGALGSDFRVFWSVGHIVIGGNAARVYDATWFTSWLDKHITPDFPAYFQAYMHYIYPPPNLLLSLLAAPFNFIDGLLVWTMALTAIGVILLRRSGAPWVVIAAGVASTAFLLDRILGQIDFVSGTLFIFGVMSIERKPRTAGAAFGTLIVKPQAGLLGPIALLARRRYDGLAAGTIVFVALCAAITILCGWAIWPAYIHDGMPAAHAALVAPFPTIYEEKGASIFWMARSLGASLTMAGGFQAIGTLGAIIWCWIAWRRPTTDRVALAALTVTLTLLVTPYGYVTDMCGFSVMVAWLAWNRRRLELADVLMWMWPALSPAIAIRLHAELTPCVLLLGSLRAWRYLTKPALTAGITDPVPENAL